MTVNSRTPPDSSGHESFQTLSVFGLSKETVADRLFEFKPMFPELELAIELDDPIIRVRIHLSGSSDSAVDAVRWICGRLGKYVFSDCGKDMEQIVGELLVEKNATLAVAESCTGGLIADLLTDVPGSSDYFLLSAVTYANQAKINVLNVKADTLERFGAVSEQTAIEMAMGARTVAGATYGLATSGIAGPTGGSDDKPVGTVCVGLASLSGATGHRFQVSDRSRRMNKRIFAITALDLLRQKLSST
jgi:nicotinamide-nucleotide amidase